MTKVSIITPVYNAEKTVARTIESVLKQTMTDFEYIIINDGSTDKTSDIVNSYSEHDSRIHQFYKDNEGIAAARNDGVMKARGEYIAFIDADDWMEENTIEILYDTAIQENVEVVVCDYRFIYDNGEEKDVVNYSFCKCNPKNHLELLVKVMPQPWNKLIKRSVFSRLEPCYPTGFVFEDLYFYACVFPQLNSMIKVDKVLINYVQLDSSIMASAKNIKKSIYDFGPVMRAIHAYYQENQFLSKYQEELTGLFARNARELIDGLAANGAPIADKIKASKSIVDSLNELTPKWYVNRFYLETFMDKKFTYRIKRRIIDIILRRGNVQFVFNKLLRGK